MSPGRPVHAVAGSQLEEPGGQLITRNQAKRIDRLKTRRRREEGSFLAEGVRLVEALLASRLSVERVLVAPALAETPRGRDLRQQIDARGLPLAELSDPELKRLADTETPQGVLAVAREPEFALSAYEPPDRAAVLVFDRIADPGNLGTLLRTAHALGVGWTVALPGGVDPWSPKTVRASAGAIFSLPVSREPWSEALSWLRDRGFAILGADPGGAPVPRSRGSPDRFALVLGNEAAGLDEEVRRDCERRVAVRLPGDLESVNVAIAGALLLDRLIGDPVD